jgi:hypothetical protein
LSGRYSVPVVEKIGVGGRSTQGASAITASAAKSVSAHEFAHQALTIRSEQKANYDTLSLVVLRTCIVAVRDLRDVEHSIEVTAETLYEAIATALAALQQDNWVGEISQGLATVTVIVQQPPVKHEVKMKDFVSWLGRQGRSPAEVILKQKLEKILGKVNQARR